MDHLPVFKYRTEPYPRVPIVTTEPYDGGPMDGYQVRQGVSISRLYERDFTQLPPHQMAAFLQNWLFFGWLSDIFSVTEPLDLSQFVELDELGLRASTKHLDACIKTWAAAIEELAGKSAEDCRAALKKVGVAQNTLHNIYHGLSSLENSPVPAEITLCMAVMGSTVDSALYWLWELGKGRDWGLYNLAAMRMTTNGWCPRDIAVSREMLSEVPMYCASFMDRKPTEFDHWYCSEDTCLLNGIDEKTYQTAHRTPGCQCEHMAPPQADIMRILDKGGIPVIQLTQTGPADERNPGQNLSMRVIEGSFLSHMYFSISHVWSDGLGNQNANSLPRCQIQFLYSRLCNLFWDETYAAFETAGTMIEYETEGTKKAIETIAKGMKFMAPGLRKIVKPIRDYRNKPVSLWIDTLCVPLDERYRNMAISRMKEVYAKSVMTVVLESELQSLEYKGCTDEELVIRIGLSGWMRRAWTFQEGDLAADWLRFLFRDGIAPLPLWRKEVTSRNGDYLMPGFFDNLSRFEGKMVEYSRARGGSEYAAPPKIPQSRIDEMVEAKKTFSMKAHTLEESKNFFKGMRELWNSVTPYASPDILVARHISTWNTLRLRSTSRESDKFICFAMACALGYRQRQDIQHLLALRPDVRMKAWVEMQTVVPAGFLFIPGQRYQDRGSRWLPTGVWRVSIEDEDYGLRERGSNLIVFKKPGFVFLGRSTSALRQETSFLVMDGETSLRYRVSWLDATVAEEILPPRDLGELAIILRKGVGDAKYMQHDIPKETGALLCNTWTNESKISGDYLGRVMVELVIEEDDAREPLFMRQVEDEQEWIVL